MLRAFRIFLNRRFFAVAIFIGTALVLFAMLEPRPRFQLTDEERFSAISFTPDGRWFITTVNHTITNGKETTTTALIRMRDLATGKTMRELGSIDGASTTIAVGADATLVAASNDNEIVIWQIADGAVRCRKKIPGAVKLLRFQPTLLAVCRAGDSKSERIEVVHLSDDGITATLAPSYDRSRSPVISHDQSRLATFGYVKGQGVVRVWNLDDGEMVCERAVPGTATIALLCFGPNNDSIIWSRFGKGTRGEPDDTQLIESKFADPDADRKTAIPSKKFFNGRLDPWWFELPRARCAFAASGKLLVVGQSNTSTLFDFQKFQLTARMNDALLSPTGDYVCCNVDSGIPGWQIRVEALPSHQVRYSRFASEGDGAIYNEVNQWTPDGGHVVVTQTNSGGKLGWLKAWLRKINVNLDFDNTTTQEIQFINPRTGKVDSSMACDDPKSLKFAPDSQCCVLDGYVYDVPFRKPWWAILGLPAVLALIVWRPYGKKPVAVATRA